MDDYVLAPVVDAGDVDPTTVGGARAVDVLPRIRNCADDEDCLQFVRSQIVPVMEYTRQNRQQMEEEWRAIRRMETLRHDEGRRYFGRSDAYIPAWARTHQTLVSSLSRGLFPSDEYMDVADRGTGDPERGKPVKVYLQWELEKNARIRTTIKPLIKQLVSYGIGIQKYWYKRQISHQGRVRRVPDVANLASAHPTFRKQIMHDGLAVSTRSAYYCYFYPVTADSMEDVTMMFEDVDVPLGFALDMVRKKVWLNEQAVRSAPTPPTHNVNQADQITATQGLTAPPSSPFQGNEVADVRVYTECWVYMPLPKDQYVGDEEVGEWLPARIVFAGTEPVSISRNPFWHQRPPYNVARLNQETGAFYGYGYGRMGRALQYLTNDFANQTNDCGIYSLNPIVFVNPGALAGPLRPLAPGVPWYMNDINEGAKFEHPDVDLIQAGLTMFNTFMGLIQDQLGAPPQMQGFGGGKGAKTATQSQILQRNAMMPLQDQVEDIERDVMIPLMFGAWTLGQQYREEAVMVAVAGQSIRVDPSDLAIDPEFRWLASSQAQNNQMRAQLATQFMQALLPFIPVLNQIGYIVDPTPMFRRIYTDGFGYRGFSEFIRPAQAAPGGMGLSGGLPSNVVPLNPGAQAGVRAEQGDRARSALEQLGAMFDGDAVPGEAEDFMDVRAQADQMAAQQGASYGGG